MLPQEWFLLSDRYKQLSGAVSSTEVVPGLTGISEGIYTAKVLVRISDNSVVLTGTSYARAGFERFDSVFSNVRAREDAENRAAGTIGEDLKSRLTAYLAGAA